MLWGPRFWPWAVRTTSATNFHLRHRPLCCRNWDRLSDGFSELSPTSPVYFTWNIDISGETEKYSCPWPQHCFSPGDGNSVCRLVQPRLKAAARRGNASTCKALTRYFTLRIGWERVWYALFASDELADDISCSSFDLLTNRSC